MQGHSRRWGGGHCTVVKTRVGGTSNIKGVSLSFVFCSPGLARLRTMQRFGDGSFCDPVKVHQTLNLKWKHIQYFITLKCYVTFRSPYICPNWPAQTPSTAHNYSNRWNYLRKTLSKKCATGRYEVKKLTVVMCLKDWNTYKPSVIELEVEQVAWTITFGSALSTETGSGKIV